VRLSMLHNWLRSKSITLQVSIALFVVMSGYRTREGPANVEAYRTLSAVGMVSATASRA
jgi:hypothetical protein